ncbi:MAG TPA: hypothetical protein VKH44_04650 [Pirellulaceae bacterium]|nr:hypothetical protein [Pirellulaceae bacterium]
MVAQIRRSIVVRIAVCLAVVFAGWMAINRYSRAGAADSVKADLPNPRAAAIAAFRTNLDYCHPWLVAKDYKSLGQSVGALSILAGAISRHTAEPGQPQIEALQNGIADLSAAAKATDSAKAEKAIDSLPSLIASVENAPLADKPKAVGKTAAGFTPLMFTIDGTFVDAKLALETGDTAAAKSDAIVLAELGQWLAADRAGDQWHTQSGDLVKAAQAAAENESNDPKALRAVFHNVYTRCEACHHRNQR